MAIQWFPGHMAQTRKKAAEAMAAVDVVIELLDARAPEASSNPLIEALRKERQRPCLKLLNKADLADPAATHAWLDHFNAQPGVRAAALSCKNASDAQKVAKLCQPLAPHRNSPLKPLRLMIMGIPNVGKSTLMNRLLKRRVAQVGDEPAVTKSLQTLSLDARTTLTDTPGLMWPKIDNAEDGLMLAALNAIGRNAILEEEVAEHLAEILLARYPESLNERYSLDPAGLDGYGALEAIAKKRGCLKPGQGSTLDLEKAALILLTEFRAGTLGRISLELPADRSRR